MLLQLNAAMGGVVAFAVCLFNIMPIMIFLHGWQNIIRLGWRLILPSLVFVAVK